MPFIPAYAGNTTWFTIFTNNVTQSSRRVREIQRNGLWPLIFIANHPGVCGKYKNCAVFLGKMTRSSRRMREILREYPNVTIDCPIIPACAGNTFLIVPVETPSAVHPGVCGKYALRGVLVACHDHSSRRMREILSLRPRDQNNCPSIPACAGNTRDTELSEQTITNHPGVCGKY